MKMWRPARLAAAILLVGVAVAGCSSGDSGTSADTAEAPGTAPGPDSSETDGREPTTEAGDPDNQAIVYTAELKLTDADPVAVAERAADLVTGASGFVAADERNAGAGDDVTVSMQLRIPADDFESTLEELSGLAESEDFRNVSTEDVQQEVTDIDSLIESKSASVDRVRDLMESASDLDEVVSLEDELTNREAELASLEARKRALDDQITYSTVALSVGTPNTEPVAHDGPDGFGEGLATGWKGFTAFLSGLVTVLGVLMPFLVTLAIPVAVVWWLIRRRAAHRRAVRTLPATAPDAPKPPSPPQI